MIEKLIGGSWRCLVFLILVAMPAGDAARAAPADPPKVHDPRLQLKLFASEPDIVTPIGLTIDARDHVWVLESHTHHPASDYTGPKGDRIKVFRDRNDDGRPEGVTVFAEGIEQGMNLAMSPRGELYVVCARQVLRFVEREGQPAAREPVLKVETSNTYAHSCLLGLTFGPDGRLYVSRGNNGSAAYVIRGTDGSQVAGYGDGGNVVRCDPDGSKLEEFATGFWNPFDLKFDRRGRLLLVDNDPDARGPNRWVHVARHGDYGYRSIYGGSGHHPFQAWDGERPGTLPMIDGTGEAPSGLLDCSRASLPEDYRDHYLVTLWNENAIARYAAQPRGVSLQATHTVLVSGGPEFRPVALDADSRGNIFFTDWVQVDYPNHGRGKIWRLSARQTAGLAKPRPAHAPPEPDPGWVHVENLLEAREPGDWDALCDGLKSEDPFVRHGAVVALSRPGFRDRTLALARDPDRDLRLGALLALRRSGLENPEALLETCLADPDPEIRRLTMIWIGEGGWASLRGKLDQAIAGIHVSAALFESYLAAVERLDPDYLRALAQRARDKASQLRPRLDPGLLEAIASDPARPARVRALALTRLEPADSPSHLALLAGLARDGDERVQGEAIRTLGWTGQEGARELLAGAALDTARDPEVRAEALVALGRLGVSHPQTLLPLLGDQDVRVQVESARVLRLSAGVPAVRDALQSSWEASAGAQDQQALVEELELALFPPGTESAERRAPRPESLDAWNVALAEGGDPRSGERVFFSIQSGCAQCHRVHNRGGRLGPDLTHLGQSVGRGQIVHSILRPSDQFPPQYQAWFVKTKDGELHQGLQLDHKAGGAIELQTAAGRIEYFKGADVGAYGALNHSLMPEGLEDAMTVTALRDLVAFLESSR